MNPARVLVTGARGFIGKRVTEALLRRGVEVHALTSGPVPAGQQPIRWHHADLLDGGDSMDHLLGEIRPWGLVHLAWYVAHGKYWEAPENRHWKTASLRLLDSFHRSGGTRALCAGTCAEYDYRVEGPYLEDSTPLRPRTLYGECKDGLRKDAQEISRRGLSLCWARLFHLYGPGELPTRLWPRLHETLAAGKPFQLQWPLRRRSFLHVADAAEAMAQLLESSFRGEVNLGSPEASTLGELSLAIARKLGREDLLSFLEPAQEPTEPLDLTPDLTRLFSLLSWKPRYSLSLGVEELALGKSDLAN